MEREYADNEILKTMGFATPDVPSSLNQLTAEQEEEKMLRLGAEKKGQEYYLYTPMGRWRVRVPSKADTYFDYADIVGGREAKIKAELAANHTSTQEQIQVGKKVMAENQEIFREAKTAQEILNHFIDQGQLFLISGINHREIPAHCLSYTLTSKDALKELETAFGQTGYYVKKIEGLGIVVQKGESAYSFLLKENFDKLNNQIIEDDDAGDDISLADRRRATSQAKKTKSPAFGKNKIGKPSSPKSSGRTSPVRRHLGLRKKADGAGFELGNEIDRSQLITPVPAPLNTPEAVSTTIQNKTGLNTQPATPETSAQPYSPTTSPTAPAPGINPGGPIGPLGPSGN